VTSLFDLPFEEPEPEPEPAPAAAVPPAAPVRRVLSVSQLTAALRELVEGRFPEVWVEGELSGARVWNTGHLYFTLKDPGAQLKGVMFRSTLRYLKFKPADGLRVVVRGRLSIYDPKGEYQIVAEHMEPQGLGALQLAFEQLKKRLQAEGLFDAARKRPLPALPRRIGIVTSIDGAALRDIVRVLRRRYPNAHLVIAPCRVQGDTAAAEVARALRRICRVDHVDVVICGRGGGSIEDLWAFNEEVVARAIAACPVPVIAAVGHETDVTIADFVADLRAPTPSAAAEIVVRRKDEFVGHIDRLAHRLRGGLTARLRTLQARLHQLQARPAFAGVPGRVAMRGRHVSELAAALRGSALAGLQRRARRVEQARRRVDAASPVRRLSRARAALAAHDGRLHAAARQRAHAGSARLGRLAARLDGLSPLAVLGRGYAVCWNADHTALVRDAGAVAPGETVHVTLDRGELQCEVKAADESRRSTGAPGTGAPAPETRV
jgi:exodeoxyribonuclease VII large subunit